MSRWPAGYWACPGRATTTGSAGPPSPRAQENELLLKHIEKIHDESRGTYGSPRVHAELTLGLGLSVNHKRVARLMREAGIQGLYRRRRRGCTVRDPAADPFPDLVNRDFTVDGPNRLWITDITEHPTAEGKVYCAAVMDVYSRLHRRLVDRRQHAHRTRHRRARHGHHPPATGRTNPTTSGRSLHSDHGSQYTSWAFGQRLRDGRPARLDGLGRRLLRQRDDGVVLGNDATRTARLENLGDTRRTCQRDIRMDRVLVQPETTPLQHRNAQPRHV